MKTNLRIFTERSYLRNPSLTILMKLSVDGHFDKSRFENALYELRNVHPLLHSSIFINNDGEAFYQANAVSQIEVHCTKREYQNQWLDVAETEIKIPFDCEKGPLIRFFVFYCEADFDVLVSVQHLLGDGNAIARLLNDVVSAYAGNSLSHQEQKLLSSQSDFPQNANLAFPAKMLVRWLNRMWNRGKQPRFGEAEYRAMFNRYHQKADIALSYATINKMEMNELYSACKAHGITINDAVVTAFMMAVQEKYLNKKMTVGIPINIRKQLSFSTDSSLGNFASAITVAYKYDSQKDFWQNTARVKKKIKSKLESTKAQWLILNVHASMNPLLIDAMYFAADGNCNDKAAKKAASILSIDKPSSTAISNIGRFDFDCQIGSYTIRDLVCFAPKAPGSYLVLGVATLDDTMQIGFSFDRNIISSAVMDEVKSKMMNLLTSHR